MDSNYIYIFIFCILLLFILLIINKNNNINNNELFNTELVKNKIAFLFLIYDEINHEEIWKLFFNSIDKNEYNIYIHYKDYKKSEYFDKYKLENIIPTTWGEISLVKAHNLLLEEALKDKNNIHFILLSNSCIPFKKFNYIYNYLDNNFSYYNISSNPNYERTTDSLKYITKNDIKKASQWSILNRKHATLLVNDKNKYINWFTVYPDEYSHITYLYYNKLNNEIIKTTDSKYDATTYTNWDENYLKNYDDINDHDILLLYNSPCLFGRKFIKNCKNLELLYKLIT